MDGLTIPKEKKTDTGLDNLLRPQDLDNYIGQESIKKRLKIVLEAAKKRKEPIEHVILYGPAGLGKTTLANIIAKETKNNIKQTSGPGIEKASDLVSLLTNLKDGEVLFIDEIHRLPRTVEESLYMAMEDFVLDITIGKGTQAKTIRLDLPHFTLIGATTKISSLTAPFRDRFGLQYHLDFYNDSEISQILNRSSKILKYSIDEKGRLALAKSSRRTPRVANRLLKRVRDYAQVKNINIINDKCVKESLDILDVDEYGLEKIDRELLRIIIENFKGGPVGIKTLAAATGEEEASIEDVYEPYLMYLGLIQRTSRGRMVTSKAYKHLKKNNIFN